MRAFLDQLGTLDDLDLVVVHEAGSAAADRRRERGAIVPTDGVRRVLEIAAPPSPQKGLLRKVHIHRSDDDDRARRADPTWALLDAFVAGAPATHEMAWSDGVAALARATAVCSTIPAVVDIDVAEDLGGVRARRAVRSWACIAHLVTVPDPTMRDRLAVPGARVVGEHDGAAFASDIAAVIRDGRAYRPIRTP